MLLTEQVLPHGLKLRGMEGTRIGMLKCQGKKIEWFGGLDDWDLRGAKAFRNDYLQCMMTHLCIQLSPEWSYHVWEAFLVTLVLKVLPNHGPDLENLGILILWDALISWATPIVFVHQTHHFHISQSSERVQQNTPRFGKSFPGTPPWSSTFHQFSSVWGWPWGKTSATCGGAGKWGAPVTRENRQLCPKGDRLNFRRKYLRLKALAICENMLDLVQRAA